MLGNTLQSRPKILCIDDDPAITMALRLRLRRYEVDVQTAADGIDGMWTAMNDRSDVIISDLRMPNGSGDYVIESLKGCSTTAEIPVIILTGKNSHSEKRWMQTLGVKHYLLKPLQIDQVIFAIEDYVELRPACDRVNY